MLVGKDILVTGGTGLIGRQVVSLLYSDGANVRTCSLDTINPNPDVEHRVGDLRDLSFCMEITRGMDYVFHLAGLKGSVEETQKRPADFFVPMLMINTNVLEACRLSEVKGVVYTSSIGAYPHAEVLYEGKAYDGQPMDFYPGWAKRMGEFQIRAYWEQYGIRFSTVRLANCYGPGDNFSPDGMVIPALMAKIRRGDNPVIVWGDGTAVRDFLYSKDAAQGIISALGANLPPIINLGSGRGYSIRELVETLRTFIDFKYEFDPTKPMGYPKRVMDISSARLLGWEPKTPLVEGLKETWEWFKEVE